MSAPYRYLAVEQVGPVEHLTLNRPDLRNALDETLVDELERWALSVPARDVRAVVLRAAGSAFCAGADITYMARTLSYTDRENLDSARAMARAFHALNRVPVPLIGRVHGAALGGGAGLVSICDIVVAAEEATFGFTEVRLGIVPAVIAPFVRAKIGESACRRLFLTGARFPAAVAREIGLVHTIVPARDLDDGVDRVVRDVLASSPTAIARAKRLLADLGPSSGDERLIDLTSRAIAEQRVSDEGQEGLRAFLEKRSPRWVR